MSEKGWTHSNAGFEKIGRTAVRPYKKDNANNII